MLFIHSLEVWRLWKYIALLPPIPRARVDYSSDGPRLNASFRSLTCGFLYSLSTILMGTGAKPQMLPRNSLFLMAGATGS